MYWLGCTDDDSGWGRQYLSMIQREILYLLFLVISASVGDLFPTAIYFRSFLAEIIKICLKLER